MHIQMLVGNIAGGKTTFRKKYCQDMYLVSRDEWRYKLSQGAYIFDMNLEPYITKCIEAEFLAAIAAGLDIVIDETNMTKRDRSWYIDLIPDDCTMSCTVMPDRGEDSHVKARLKDNHGNNTEETWRSIYRKKQEQYQEPTIQEGFDIVSFII